MLNKNHKRKSKGFFFILLLFDMFLIILSSLSEIIVKTIDPSDTFYWLNAFLIYPLLLSLILTGIILFYYYYYIRKPINVFENAQEKLAVHDLKNLSIAIAELAGGNLTSQVNISADLVNKQGKFETNGLIELYEKSYNFIKESVEYFNAVTSEACKRLYYIGADSFREGKKCGEIMGDLLNGKGYVVIMLAGFKLMGNNLRNKGFQSSIAKLFPDIHIMEIIETHNNPDITYQKTIDMIKKYPKLNGIYICEGYTPHGAAKALNKTGKVGNIKIVTHDVTDGTMQAIIKGEITATLSQNPFAQGYDPVIHLYNFLVTNVKPVISRLLTDMTVITKDNYKEYWSPEKGVILSKKELNNLEVPVENPTSKLYKIAVILPDDTLFFKPVAEGAFDAVNKLKAFNVEVKCINLDVFRKVDWSAKVFIPVIESLLKEGYQAITLPIFDKDLVPFLNEKISHGLVVVIYNSEPVSFRGMVETVSVHSTNLFQISVDLAAGSSEANQVTEQISMTMRSIKDATQKQLEQFAETESSMNNLQDNITDVLKETDESASVSKETLRAAETGFEAVRKNHEAILALKKSSELTTQIINTLNQDANKIQEIVGIIEDIASQTNVLAINAAIQSTHAGDKGMGFSVVAIEIKKLAEQSVKATTDIKSLINTIQAGVGQATKVIVDSITEVEKSAEIADKAEAALNDILKITIENESKINNIMQTADSMKQLSENVSNAMSEQAKLNKNNSNSINEITKSVNEMNLEVVNITKTAQLLREMSQSHGDLISQFVLEEKKK